MSAGPSGRGSYARERVGNDTSKRERFLCSLRLRCDACAGG